MSTMKTERANPSAKLPSCSEIVRVGEKHAKGLSHGSCVKPLLGWTCSSPAELRMSILAALRAGD
jgi:hypothetical protein